MFHSSFGKCAGCMRSRTALGPPNACTERRASARAAERDQRNGRLVRICSIFYFMHFDYSTARSVCPSNSCHSKHLFAEYILVMGRHFSFLPYFPVQTIHAYTPCRKQKAGNSADSRILSLAGTCIDRLHAGMNEQRFSKSSKKRENTLLLCPSV